MAAAPTDFAALYLRHRDRMHAVAHSVLRGTPQRNQVEDAVMDAIASLIASPPKQPVGNWEAFLVRATRNKALDLLKAAHSRHGGGPLEDHHHHHHPPSDAFMADDVAQRVDVQRYGAALWDKLAVLDTRERNVLWEYKALGHPRAQVARKFGISPARVSQISTQALNTVHEELAKEGVQP